MDRAAVVRERARALLIEQERRTGRAYSPRGDPNPFLELVARRCFRLTVFEEPDLPAEVEGMLDLDADLILIQPGLSAPRRAFVVAHELGHRALEHPPRQLLDTEAELDENLPAEDLADRDGVFRAYSEADRWEREANAFAGELLVPLEILRSQVRADLRWSVERLAARFGVSKALLRNRLAAAFLVGQELSGEARSAVRGTPHHSDAGQPAPLPTIYRSPASDLDPAQQAAVEAPTPALVIAGPGAGKTRVLVRRFERLVAQGMDPRRILALTFSNRAAGEMQDRLAAALPDQAHALHVTTFHALGLQLLREFGFALGYPEGELRLLPPMDEFVFLRPHIAGLPLGEFEDLHRPTRDLGLLLRVISRLKDEQIGPREFADQVARWQAVLAADESGREGLAEERAAAARAADLATLYPAIFHILRSAGAVDYGDLVSEAVRLCGLPEIGDLIRNRFSQILVDEFQDINYAGGRLVRALDGGRGIVWAVGDPRQSIYRFRGASPANLLEFSRDYPGAKVHFLDRNYRSVASIVACGEAAPRPDLPPELTAPPLLPVRPDRDGGPVIELTTAPDGNAEVAHLAFQIGDLLEAGREPGEMAVLCRTRSQAQRVAAALGERGIATTWNGALEDQPLFQDLMGVLLLAADDPRGLPRMARFPDHALTEEDLRALLETGRAPGRSARALLRAGVQGEVPTLSAPGRRVATRLLQLAGRLAHAGGAWETLATYLFEEAGWVRDLLADDSPSARQARSVVGQVAGLAREFPGRATLLGADSAATFVEFLELALEAGELPHGDGGASSDAVAVLTAHRSKGLEWPIVFVPYLAAGHFPPKEQPPEFRFPPDTLRGADMQTGDEELCLFYVAVTRARDRLYLSCAERYANRACPPSPYVQSLRAGLPADVLAERTAPPAPPPLDPPPRPQHAGWKLGQTAPASLLARYEACPRRFLYETVYGLEAADRGYRDFHRVVYGMMSRTVECAAAKEPLTAEQLTTELEARWQEEGPHGHLLEPLYRRRADTVIREFHTRVGSGAPVSLRPKLLVPVGNRLVEVTLDEVESGPRPVYRRHHLGRPAKAHLEEHALMLAASVTGNAELRLAYPAGAEEVPVFPTARKVQNRLTKMADLIRAIEAGEFTPKPNQMQCARCRFRLICPMQEGRG